MKKSSIIKRILAASLAIMLVTPTSIRYVYAKPQITDNKELQSEEIKYTSIEINGEDDLIEIANNCHIDNWSKDKKILLKEDIKLTNPVDVIIPVFEGIFEGNGHTITNFIYEGDGYSTGLFRYVGKYGEVRNLTVEGKLVVSGEKKTIGGICGENAGVIKNCRFRGTIEGKTQTGGIAGVNASGGVITGCSSHGYIAGYYYTGGIAGKNHGSITNCNNQAGINNKESWVLEDDETNFDWIKNIKGLDDTIIQSGVDTGGIAGYSDGIVTSCSNSATIGYEHTGYNIGGIIGRSCGICLLCQNEGTILGRKDVGGIVGQMEPHIKISDADSITDAVQKLHDLIDKTLDDLESTRKTISADCDELEKVSDGALNTSHTIVDMLSQFVDDNVDAINAVSEQLKYVIDNVPEALDYIDDAFNNMSAVSDDFTKINEDLAIVDKLKKEEYSELDYKRLVLTSSIGGELSCDNTDPAEGVLVTITSNAQSGYTLSNVWAVTKNGEKIELDKEGANYKLTMPKENVEVCATYDYTGEFIAASNAGGVVSVTDGNDKVEVSYVCQGGYRLDKFTVGGKEVTFADNNKITLNKSDYEKKGQPVICYGKFSKKENAKDITVETTMGGTCYTDSSSGSVGDEITVTVSPLPNYKLDKLYANDIDITGNLEGTRKYKFSMPDEKVTVKAIFTYDTSNAGNIYCESNVGGNVVSTPTSSSDVYRITLNPSTGFAVAGGNCVLVYEDGNDSPVKTVTFADMTSENGGNYSYSLDIAGMIKPVKVYGVFEKKPGELTITTVGSTGGAVVTNDTIANEKDKIKVVVTPLPGYRVKKISATSGLTEVALEETTENLTYTFIMPNGDVEIKAEFEPLALVLTSNEGGSASYTIDKDKAKLIITQRAGYTLSENPVLISNDGTEINLSKTKASTFEYEFVIPKGSYYVSGTVAFKKQSQYATLISAKDNLEESYNTLNKAINTSRNLSDELKKILIDSDGNVKSWDNLTDEDKNKVISDVVNLATSVSDASYAASQMISDIAIIANVAGDYIEDTSVNLNEDIEKLNKDVQAVIDNLDLANEKISGIANYLKAQNKIKFSKLGDEFDQNVDTLYSQLTGISNAMKKIGDDIDINSEKLNKDFRAVNDQLNVVLLLLIEDMEKITNPDAINVYEDVSDDDIDDIVEGKVSQCTNRGNVRGDIDVGGVAGAMSIDDEDLEGNAAGKTTVSLGSKYLTKCVLSNCSNYGFVTAKKDGAGSVVGFMNLGVATECEAYGKVSSTEGDYVGGICGQSMGIIRKCYSLSTLSGKAYVGGIAGYADAIFDCYSMVNACATEGRVGAIAGQTGYEKNQEEQKQSDYAKGNYYVGDSLYGIDDISYVGVCEPLTYSELLEVVGLPNEFRHLKISYIVDDKVVSVKEVPYGTELSTVEHPLIVDKENENGIWKEPISDTMTGNIFMEAEYRDNVKILSSDEKIKVAGKNGEVEKAYAFAEGIFNDDSKLFANISDEGSFRVIELELMNTKLSDNDNTKVRLLGVKDDKDKVYKYEDGDWVLTESLSRGDYRQVVMEGTRGKFLIKSSESYKTAIIISCGIGAFALLSIVMIVVNAKKRAKKRKQLKG